MLSVLGAAKPTVAFKLMLGTSTLNFLNILHVSLSLFTIMKSTLAASELGKLGSVSVVVKKESSGCAGSQL